MEPELHRRMGVETNNEAWRMLGEEFPADDEAERELDRFFYMAYASAYHWMEAPEATVANRIRSEHLIARAATAVGRAETALRHARRCVELCAENASAIEDWDLAFATEGLARAHAAAGDMDEARTHRDVAARLGAAIAEADDREVFLEELNRGPWFGLEV